MSNIMLAKNAEDVKWKFPLYISEKLDGVACRFEMTPLGIMGTTRQGVPVTKSVLHIEVELAELLDIGEVIIGEVWMPMTPFKIISGLFRKDAYAPQLQFKAYDFLTDLNDTSEFNTRLLRLERLPEHLRVHQNYVTERPTMDSIAEFIQTTSEAYEFEGWMLRPALGDESRFKFNRSNGMLRMVPKPTVDLKVEGLVEAVSKEGVPKGEVGAFQVIHNGQLTKVGAGKSSKVQRAEWWNNPESILGKTIQIQYKHDASYDGLRQPTFQRTREDKDA